MSTDPIIRIEHCHQIGFCSRGVRTWLQSVGLDYWHFVQHGYKVSEIEPVNDAMSNRLIEHVRSEEG